MRKIFTTTRQWRWLWLPQSLPHTPKQAPVTCGLLRPLRPPSTMIQPDEMRASKMIGSTVYDVQNRNIGSVKDLILDKRRQSRQSRPRCRLIPRHGR